MFNLDQAIANWRQQLRAAGVKDPARLDELESHLREDVERQTKSGIDARQAFEEAASRIGPVATIVAEFRKVPRTIPIWEQRLLRIYCVAFPVFYLCLASYALFKMDMTFVERALGFAAVGFTCLLILFTPLYHKFLPVIPDRRLRVGLQIAPALLWMIGGYGVMTYINLPVGQLVVVILWLMTPTAAISGIGCGLDEAARRKIVKLAD